MTVKPLGLALVMASLAIDARDTQASTNWYRIPLTATNPTAIAANQTNFPILVRFTPDNFAFAHANSNGYDLRFTADDAATLLSYERERHDATAGVAEYWVKLPILSSQTLFYAYYRPTATPDGAAPANVWDDDYRFVHHLAESSGSCGDSTTNAVDGVPSGLTLGTAGAIAGAVQYPSSGGGDLPIYSLAARPPTATFEGWFKADTLGAGWLVLFSGANFGYALAITADGHLQSLVHNGNAVIYNTGASVLSAGTWHYVADVYGNQGRCLYVDGVLDASVADTTIPYSTWFIAGQHLGYGFKGQLDEMRMSSTVRSAAWIKAQHASMRGQLLAYGTEEVTEDPFIQRRLEFMPLGVYWPGEYTWPNDPPQQRWTKINLALDGMAARYINAIWVTHLTPADTADIAWHAALRGIYLVASMECFDGNAWRSGPHSDADYQHLIETAFAEWGSAPVPIAWGLGDEPSGDHFPDFEQWVNVWNSEYPEEAITTVIVYSDIAAAGACNLTALTTDYYCFAPLNSPIGRPPSMVEVARYTSQSSARPWIMGQSCQMSGGGPCTLDDDEHLVYLPGSAAIAVMPTPAQMRWQSWMPLAQGAKGIFFYLYNDFAAWCDSNLPPTNLSWIYTNTVDTGEPISLVYSDGSTTPQYDALGETFSEIQALSSVLWKLCPTPAPEAWITLPAGDSPQAGMLLDPTTGQRYLLVVAGYEGTDPKAVRVTLGPHIIGLTNVLTGASLALTTNRPYRCATVTLTPGAGALFACAVDSGNLPLSYTDDFFTDKFKVDALTQTHVATNTWQYGRCLSATNASFAPEDASAVYDLDALLGAPLPSHGFRVLAYDGLDSSNDRRGGVWWWTYDQGNQPPLFNHNVFGNNGLLRDSTSNGIGGVANATVGGSNAIGCGAQFTGRGGVDVDYFQCPATATIEAWFKADNVDAGTIFRLATPSVNVYYSLMLAQGKTLSYLHWGNGIVSVTGSVSVTAGEWHYVADRYGAQGRATFLDGIAQGSNASTLPPWSGYTHESMGDSFQGMLDEVRLSKVARSAAWLKAQNACLRDQLLQYGDEETGPYTVAGVTYPYRRPLEVVTLSAIDAPQTNFPLLVTFTAANFSFAKAHARGRDLRFTAADGATLLSFERERHDAVAGHAEYWVKLPILSSTANTKVYVHYGATSVADGSHATNVWDSDYLMVQHFAPTDVAPFTNRYLKVGVSWTNDPGMTAFLTRFGVSQWARPVTLPPTVSLSSPAGGTVFTAPATVSIAAVADDTDGAVASVSLYEDGNSLGTSAGPTFTGVWVNASSGTHSLTAVATDDDGATTTSTPVTITVNDVPAPALTSPANNRAYLLPAIVTWTATVANTVGWITNVSFYTNGAYWTTGRVVTANTSYTNVWKPAMGRYELTAKVWDSYGASASSPPITNVLVWTNLHIGANSGDTAATYSAPVYTVNGRGVGITNTADAFRFVYLPMTGNCTIVARLTNVTGTASAGTRLGVMMRASTNANAIEAASLFMPQNNRVYFHRRTSGGGATTMTYSNAAALPYWVKLSRSNDMMRAYGSADGTTWMQVGTNTTTSTLLVGLAVTSGGATTTVTGKFDNVSVTVP